LLIEDYFQKIRQTVDSSNKLIFRYDNTGHHKELNLPTYPHHKHDGEEKHVITSEAPELSILLDEIEMLMR